MPVRMHWGVVGVSCLSGPLLLGPASCGDGHRALREVMLTCRVGNPSFIYSVEAFQMSSCMRGHIAIAHRVVAKTGSSMAEGSSPVFGVIHPLCSCRAQTRSLGCAVFVEKADVHPVRAL